jgi:predicted amidohydrolase
MHMFVVAGLLAAEVAVAAPAPPTVPAAEQGSTVVVVPENWAAPPPPDRSLIKRAARESIEDEKALAAARSKEAAIPQRYTASSHPDQDKYEKFETTFADAKVPGCFKSDGLKRQSTLIFGGLLALPFIAVAAIRGKCN